MKLRDINNRYIGDWGGNHRLILSWLPDPDFNSDSNLAIKAVANDKFLLLTYNWQTKTPNSMKVFYLRYSTMI